MNIAGAFDVHHRQLTFDYLDTVTGRRSRGREPRLTGSTCGRGWPVSPGRCGVHPEGCTGWLNVAEGRTAAHLAEPEAPVRHDRGVTRELFLEINC
jgi:transposase